MFRQDAATIKYQSDQTVSSRVAELEVKCPTLMQL